MNITIKTILINVSCYFLFLILLPLVPTQMLAQMEPIEGNNSEEFFDQGNQELEQEINTLENEQSQEPTEAQEEQKLEQELNIQEKNPQAPRIENVPAPGVGNNVPTPPPTGETEIVIPE